MHETFLFDKYDFMLISYMTTSFQNFILKIGERDIVGPKSQVFANFTYDNRFSQFQPKKTK